MECVGWISLAMLNSMDVVAEGFPPTLADFPTSKMHASPPTCVESSVNLFHDKTDINLNLSMRKN